MSALMIKRIQHKIIDSPNPSPNSHYQTLTDYQISLLFSRQLMEKQNIHTQALKHNNYTVSLLFLSWTTPTTNTHSLLLSPLTVHLSFLKIFKQHHLSKKDTTDKLKPKRI